MWQRKASFPNLTMKAYDYIIVTELLQMYCVLAGLIYGEKAWAHRAKQRQNMADWLVFS